MPRRKKLTDEERLALQKFYQKQWRDKSQEKILAYRNHPDVKIAAKAWRLRNDFGVTPIQYEVMFRAQDGRCAICRDPPGKKRLAVDHCHVSNVVRGLLCGQCNLMLGNGRDSIMNLRAGIAYLEVIRAPTKHKESATDDD